MLDHDFLDTFLDEAQETLDRWESACLRLERAASAGEDLKELFRLAHNIKGSAKSVGLVAFAGLVHRAEDLITKLQKNESKITELHLGLLFDCHKTLANWVEAIRERSDAEPDHKDLLRRLEEFKNGEGTRSTETAAFGFFDDDDAPKTPRVSEVNSGKAGPKDIGAILIEGGHVTQEQIEQVIRQQNRKLGEVLVETGLVSPEVIQSALEIQKASGHRPDETIRVSLRKLDSVIRLIGELSIQLAIVSNAKATDQLQSSKAAEAIDLTSKVIQDLQTEAMNLRMQPLDNLFQRMERVCRDVARQQGKHLQVSLLGTDVELDKTVIEKMKDPLVHILRNAVDHGIETSEERQKTGKPPMAEICIEGIQTATNVSIRISDDGRGLNLDRIRRKAIEKGLLGPNVALTPREIQELIFLPGFSTADRVTDLSGRGVGMDVVRRSVDELGGTITIDSTEGKGTQFLITLPSTLSILDAVIVRLGDALYAVPVQDVEEVVDIQSAKVESSTPKGRIMNLRGRVLPIEHLADYLPQRERLSSERGVALITRFQSTSVAFQVDHIAGQQAIVVRQLEGKLADVPGLAGATILSNGEPSMIVHLPQLVKSYLATMH